MYDIYTANSIVFKVSCQNRETIKNVNSFVRLFTNKSVDDGSYFQTGDEMSKRSKFVFCTWVGPNVSVMKKAKMSTDKALLKEIITVSKNIIYP